MKVAVSPSVVALSHGRLEPNEPELHATFWMAAGAVTVVFASTTGTVQSVPTPFHTSSSWSANPLSAPRTRYVIS